MMHSHSAIQFLVQQAEAHAKKKERKKHQPLWLQNLVEEMVDFFDPATDTARVGYECHFDDDLWQLQLYLGDIEFFGGSQDGKRQPVPFDFDLKSLLNLFETVTSVRHRRLETGKQESGTKIEICGQLQTSWGGESIRLAILSQPPQHAGPGVRIHQDGRIETI